MTFIQKNKTSRFSPSLLLKRGSQAGDPAIVALKGSAKDELLSHDQGWATGNEP
jgi:hypothetical protein